MRLKGMYEVAADAAADTSRLVDIPAAGAGISRLCTPGPGDRARRVLVEAPAKIEDSSRRTCRGCAPAPVGGPRRDVTESGDNVLLGAGRIPPPPNSTLIVAVLTVEDPPRRLCARLGRALSAGAEDACSGDATPRRRESGARSVAAASVAAGRVVFGSLVVPASTAPGTSSSLSRWANAGSS